MPQFSDYPLSTASSTALIPIIKIGSPNLNQNISIENLKILIDTDDEYTGYTGSVGPRGFFGSRGSSGYVGSIGLIGYIGSIGNAGTTGFRGSAGSEGQGFTGSVGEGSNGLVGDIGFTGSEGQGFTGSIGEGYVGSVGNIGFVGSQGNLGFVGSQGILGITGYVGSTEGAIGAAWTVVAGWDFTQGSTGSVTAKLVGFGDVMAMATDVRLANTGTLILQVSANNQSSWFDNTSSYYTVEEFGSTSTSRAGIPFYRDTTISTRSGLITAKALNKNGMNKIIRQMSPDFYAFVGTTTSLTHVRAIPSQGGDITTGSIYILVR